MINMIKLIGASEPDRKLIASATSRDANSVWIEIAVQRQAQVR